MIYGTQKFNKSKPILAAKEDTLKVLIADMQTAKDMGGNEQRDFMVKSLNMWVNNTDDQFIDVENGKNVEQRKL